MTSTQSSPEPVVAPPPRAVSRFEAHLLRLLRSILRPQVGEPALPPTAAGKLSVPPGLSDECLELVRDALGKGCVVYLARAGGWRCERHLRDGRAVEGRLWQRQPAGELGLTFSRHALHFLMWLTAGRPDGAANWAPPLSELTPADQLLLLLAHERLRDTETGTALRARPALMQNGLVRLFFPEDFCGNTAELDYAPWTHGVGAAIIEALQPRLQRLWLERERAKRQIGDWLRLRGLGQSQEHALGAFLNACEAAGRPDLARFLLRAFAELLSPDLTPAFWVGGLLPSAAPPRLAERLDVKRQGLAPLRQLERLAGWTRRFKGTQFFDEDYATAQLWLSDWERYDGDTIVHLAQGLLRQLEPLRAAAPAAAAEPGVRSQES
jgi:FtsH ternary system-associated peptide